MQAVTVSSPPQTPPRGRASRPSRWPPWADRSSSWVPPPPPPLPGPLLTHLLIYKPIHFFTYKPFSTLLTNLHTFWFTNLACLLICKPYLLTYFIYKRTYLQTYLQTYCLHTLLSYLLKNLRTLNSYIHSNLILFTNLFILLQNFLLSYLFTKLTFSRIYLQACILDLRTHPRAHSQN